MVSTVCQGTLLRSLKSLSRFKFLNDLVLMIVCSRLVECLLHPGHHKIAVIMNSENKREQQNKRKQT